MLIRYVYPGKKWGFVKENPVNEVKRYKEKPKDVEPLRREKEKELLERLKDDPRSWHVWVIVLVALYTGMRKGEVLKLRREHVNFRKRLIHVTHTKNWETRDIPLITTL